MHGLMTDYPLLISSIIEHAAKVYGKTEVVSRTVEGPIHRYTWKDVRQRSRHLAGALKGRGSREGDRIATIAWNGYRHLELYYAVSGMGAVIHTVNPRLHPSQIAYILNHAEDRVLFVDLTFIPLVEGLVDQLESVRGIVAMTDRAHMPKSSLDLICYEELLEEHPGDYDWPRLDENSAAAICYTSGTTGHPKGVVYTHRSTLLHAYGSNMPNVVAPRRDDVVLPVVPMFHVNAWGIPYSAAMCGAKIVFPGPHLEGEVLTELMNAEGVTTYAGVPTVHMGLIRYWEESGTSVPSLKLATTGGAAPNTTMLRAFLSRGIGVLHGWGLTETSPIGTTSKVEREEPDLDDDAKIDRLMKQGQPLFGVEVRIVDEAGEPLPQDGSSCGEIQIRGPWVCSAYYGEEPGSRLDAEGWFSTGDLAVIEPDCTVRITDRKKDLIKSGGEWISSIDLEELAMRHPEIAHAAVIGVPHEKWGERPLLVAVAKPGARPTRESVLEFLEGQVAKWWLPDDVVFVDQLPIGGTGKVQKAKLRERFAS